MSNSKPFPWHYFIRSVRSRIFYILTTALLTYIITQHYKEELLVKIIILSLGIITVAFIHSLFRIIPFRNLLYKFDNIQMKLPHDKKLSIIYEKDEWVLLEEMIHLADHYISQQQDLIENQSEQSHTILENIPNSIVIIDKFENCKSYNSHFQKRFLSDLDCSILENVKTFKVFDENLVTSFKEAILADKCIKISGLYFSKQNEYFDVAITPIHNKDKKVTGALGIFHNVTELKLTEKMRVDFVANVSHEIRTPLTSIKGYGQLLQAYEEKVSDEIKPILLKIDRNADRLQDLFDNLLKLSVIESKYELNMSEISVRTLFNLIEHNIKAKYLGERITFIFKIEIETILGDEMLLEQLFTNLIDNAVKYARAEQEVIIAINTYDLQNDYCIQISDNGPGMQQEELTRIFERFYRVQGVSTKNIEGSGLGLSIAKHIVNKHQGDISVKSQVNEGTCFTIKLPH